MIASLNSGVKNSFISIGAKMNNMEETPRVIIMETLAYIWCLLISLARNGKNVRDMQLIKFRATYMSLLAASKIPFATFP